MNTAIKMGVFTGVIRSEAGGACARVSENGVLLALGLIGIIGLRRG
jgi:hypothetical protein